MNNSKPKNVDVLVIGAGPSGSLVSALLNQANIDVMVIEKQLFPRFSIGESLLPQLMVFLEKAGMSSTIEAANYQYKNGAAFRKNGVYSDFNFKQKFSEGPGTTFQVKRAEFDKRLADCAEEQGVKIRYQHEVLELEEKDRGYLVTVQDQDKNSYQINAKFVLDASGFGRVLPRLLNLETPSGFPMRQSIFCHVKDNITDETHDRNKILVSVHPENNEVWYWLIPFSDGTSSVGVVATPEFLGTIKGEPEEQLLYCIGQEPDLKRLLSNAKRVNDVQTINGYSANVTQLCGEHFALLGNAGEFLDPVFSSGVTIAFKSADLAANLLIKQFSGKSVCWEQEYSTPLMKGVNTFRAFVQAWYDGRLQDIIFYQDASSDVREMVCSILAGYAWDENNPYVAKPGRRLNVLADICKGT